MENGRVMECEVCIAIRQASKHETPLPLGESAAQVIKRNKTVPAKFRHEEEETTPVGTRMEAPAVVGLGNAKRILDEDILKKLSARRKKPSSRLSNDIARSEPWLHRMLLHCAVV